MWPFKNKYARPRDISIPSKCSLGEWRDIDGNILNGHCCNRKHIARLKMESGKIAHYRFKECTYGGTTDWHYDRWEFVKYEKESKRVGV